MLSRPALFRSYAFLISAYSALKGSIVVLHVLGAEISFESNVDSDSGEKGNCHTSASISCLGCHAYFLA